MKRMLALIFLSWTIPVAGFAANEPVIRTAFWLENQPGILMAFLLVAIGITVALYFVVSRKSSELYLLSLAIFIIGYGLRMFAENPLVLSAVNAPPLLWEYIKALVTNFLPVFFIFFLQAFIGWGWKRSIFWLILGWLLYAVTAMAIGIAAGNPNMVNETILNNILVVLMVVILGINSYYSRGQNTRERRIIGTGLTVFIAGVLFNNLFRDNEFVDGSTLEEVAFFFFVCCMIWAAVSRSRKTEQEYQSILHDLETARQIQLAILPRNVPSSSSFAIFPTYIPMTAIGGDFYAFHQAGNNHVGVLVADVSGHGIPAALLASMIKVAFNSLADDAGHPASLLGSVNQVLTGQLNNEFITAAYLWFDLEKMILHHASAGHPTPILIRNGRAEEQSFPVKGIPIGVTENFTYTDEKVTIAPGDRIVIYTDGLTEAFNPRGELFGKERLLSALGENSGLPGGQVSDHIIAKVREWAGKSASGSMEDDVTVVVVDIK